MVTALRVAAWTAAATWVGLAVARGRFWDATADGLRRPASDRSMPRVHAVIPARDEADVIGGTLASVLRQRYAGDVRVTLVDDRSVDGTGAIARATIAASDATERACVVDAAPRPAGWTGKMWALREGVAAARASGEAPVYWWFTDADVYHADDTLARLVATAMTDRRDLVSQMVALHCATSWERLLIPAFVYFFRMLYPFSWVNDDARDTAGAAGGCVVLADASLARIGGIERIAGELIDDCALARAVKRDGGRLRLELATRSRSVRPYVGLAPIWNMVARSAYTQLGYSRWRLAGTVAAMALVYVVPPAATVGGVLARRPHLAVAGALGWAVMTATYLPTIRLYRLAPHRALTLPLAAVLYAAMTVDSALRHRAGRGGAWKGRAFTPAGREGPPPPP